MNEAVLEASYSDFKLIKTRSVISLSFEVPVEQANLVHQVLGIPQPGHEMSVAIARLNHEISPSNHENSKSKGEHGDYARKLYTSGFFLHQEVLEALGTDEEFLAWIRLQPSCVSKQFSEYVNDEGRCVAAHVRRVHAGAGGSLKPPYSAVPLTQAEHDLQHQHGERNLVNSPHDKTVDAAKEWFWKQRCEYVTEWAKERLKWHLAEPDSLANIAPELIRAWAEAHNLTNFLPRE